MALIVLSNTQHAPDFVQPHSCALHMVCVYWEHAHTLAGEAEVAEESQGLLGQFIDYIQAHKTVPLEQVGLGFWTF